MFLTSMAALENEDNAKQWDPDAPADDEQVSDDTDRLRNEQDSDAQQQHEDDRKHYARTFDFFLL
jgi:hypothetical protein